MVALLVVDIHESGGNWKMGGGGGGGEKCGPLSDTE